MLLGRNTYELFAAAWPGRDGELADKYNSMPKYVVSSTLTDPTWNDTRVIAGDVVAEVTKLKDQVAGELQVPGSIQLSRVLLANDLVDEIHLMTFPLVLGTGRRLFGETPNKTRWTLAESTTVGEGILVTIFHRAC